MFYFQSKKIFFNKNKISELFNVIKLPINFKKSLFLKVLKSTMLNNVKYFILTHKLVLYKSVYKKDFKNLVLLVSKYKTF